MEVVSGNSNSGGSLPSIEAAAPERVWSSLAMQPFCYLLNSIKTLVDPIYQWAERKLENPTTRRVCIGVFSGLIYQLTILFLEWLNRPDPIIALQGRLKSFFVDELVPKFLNSFEQLGPLTQGAKERMTQSFSAKTVSLDFARFYSTISQKIAEPVFLMVHLQGKIYVALIPQTPEAFAAIDLAIKQFPAVKSTLIPPGIHPSAPRGALVFEEWTVELNPEDAWEHARLFVYPHLVLQCAMLSQQRELGMSDEMIMSVSGAWKEEGRDLVAHMAAIYQTLLELDRDLHSNLFPIVLYAEYEGGKGSFIPGIKLAGKGAEAFLRSVAGGADGSPLFRGEVQVRDANQGLYYLLITGSAIVFGNRMDEERGIEGPLEVEGNLDVERVSIATSKEGIQNFIMEEANNEIDSIKDTAVPEMITLLRKIPEGWATHPQDFFGHIFQLTQYIDKRDLNTGRKTPLGFSADLEKEGDSFKLHPTIYVVDEESFNELRAANQLLSRGKPDFQGTMEVVQDEDGYYGRIVFDRM